MPFWTPEPLWKDETVIVLGGGRSLLGFSWSLLSEYRVIGCNLAYRLGSHLIDACIMCDKDILYQYREEIERYNGIVFFNFEEIKVWNEANCPSWAYSLPRFVGGGLSPAEGLGWNGHTGAAALNLALILGAKKVVLLGFDMKTKDVNNPDWYSTNDPRDIARPAIPDRFENWLHTFPHIIRDWKEMYPDVEIINVSDDTGLTQEAMERVVRKINKKKLDSSLTTDCFPIQTVNEFFHGGSKPVQSIEKDVWKGKRCYIVGGGYSLNRFDLSKLKDELTIVCNHGFEHMPFIPTIAFTISHMLGRYYQNGNYGIELKKKWLSLPCKIWTGEQRGRPLAIHGKDPRPRVAPGFGKANNSGLAALKLANFLGASEINLVGFDMKNENGQSHYYKESLGQNNENVFDSDFRRFIDHFESYAEKAKEKARIINLNPESNLRCFEFGEFQKQEAITV